MKTYSEISKQINIHHHKSDGCETFSGNGYVFICDGVHVVVWSHTLNNARIKISSLGYSTVVPMGKATIDMFI